MKQAILRGTSFVGGTSHFTRSLVCWRDKPFYEEPRLLVGQARRSLQPHRIAPSQSRALTAPSHRQISEGWVAARFIATLTHCIGTCELRRAHIYIHMSWYQAVLFSSWLLSLGTSRTVYSSLSNFQGQGSGIIILPNAKVFQIRPVRMKLYRTLAVVGLALVSAVSDTLAEEVTGAPASAEAKDRKLIFIKVPRALGLNELIGAMKTAPNGTGFRHMGPDGVLRSFDSDFHVVDYLKLSPPQIEQLAAVFLPISGTELANMTGVDGRNVPNTEAEAPSKQVLAMAGEASAKSAAAVAALPANPAAGLLQKRGCGTIVCAKDSTCEQHGCFFCRVFVEGLGFCIGFT